MSNEMAQSVMSRRTPEHRQPPVGRVIVSQIVAGTLIVHPDKANVTAKAVDIYVYSVQTRKHLDRGQRGG